MFTLAVVTMNLVDRIIFDYLKSNASEGRVTVRRWRIVDELNVSTATVSRSICRLQASGHLSEKTGNRRVGYTYTIHG